MVVASLAFALMAAAVKVVRAEMTALDVVFWRGVLSVPILLLLTGARGLAVRDGRTVVLRAVLGFGAMTCYYTAAKGLLVADLTLISELTPLLIAAAAPLVLGASERGAARTWAVLVLGLAGCALLVGPQLAVGSVWGLWAVAATFFSAAAHLVLRKLGRTDGALVIVFWFQLGGALLAFAVSPLLDGQPVHWPRGHQWLPLLVVGVTATLGQLLMTRAYALDRAASVAAASYTGPVWALLVDVVVFATLPAPLALLGGALVVGAGLWLILGPSPDKPPAPGPAA